MNRWRIKRVVARVLLWAFVVALMLGVLYFIGPRDAQIQISTGDLRYRVWGIPVSYPSTPRAFCRMAQAHSVR
jgi:hypothetical protein